MIKKSNLQVLHGTKTLLAAALLVIVFQIGLAIVGTTPILSGRLWDSDNYMWLQRGLDLHAGGSWYHAFSARTNAPFGESLHWTRPLDIILFAGAWLGSGFTDFRNALFVWGALVSPIFLLLAIPLWSWGTRPLFGNWTFLLSIILIPILFPLSFAFIVGRPDHHSLLALLFIVQLSIIIRLMFGLVATPAAALAGFVCGLALWVSVESLLSLVMFGGGLALLWIWHGREHARHLAAYTMTLFVTLTAVIPAQLAPSEWMTPIYRHVSVVHWALAGLAAIVWLGIAALPPRVRSTKAYRTGLGLAAAVLSGGVMAALFPSFFDGPFVEYDPVIVSEFLSQVFEFTSLVPNSHCPAIWSTILLWPPLIAIVYGVLIWWHGSPCERDFAAFFVFGMLIFLPLAIYEARWLTYVDILALLYWPSAIVALDRLGQQKATPYGRGLTRAFFLIFSLVGGAIIGLAFKDVDNKPSSNSMRKPCDWTVISKILTTRHERHPEEHIVLTYLFDGPELVWRTPYDVVGAPYANTRSLGDTARFFRATNDEDARAVVDERGVDLVLLCTSYPDNKTYSQNDAAFLNRLIQGNAPPWLKQIALPADKHSTLRIFRVIKNSHQTPPE